MCEIVSVAVHPQTLEIFHKPGMWHHTDICKAFGLEYDRMFKPDLVLADRSVRFNDGDVVIAGPKLPPELERLLLEEAQKSDAEFSLKYTLRWQEKHEKAVKRWMEENLGTGKQLIGFSEHSWVPNHYLGTLREPKQNGSMLASVNELMKRRIPYPEVPSRESLVLRTAWQRLFEKPSLLSEAWRER